MSALTLKASHNGVVFFLTVLCLRFFVTVFETFRAALSILTGGIQAGRALAAKRRGFLAANESTTGRE